MAPFLRSVAFLLLAVVPSACNVVPDWVTGTPSDEERLPGDRISVIKSKGKIQVDPDLHAKTKVFLPESLKNAGWYQSHGSQQDTFSQHISLGKKLDVRETFDAVEEANDEYYLTATPVVAGDRVYIIGGQGDVSAFPFDKPEEPLWTQQTVDESDRDSVSSGGLSYSDQRLFVTNGRHEVIALNADSGSRLWVRPLDNIIRSVPVPHNDKLYVMTISNTLYCLEQKTGRVVWSHLGVTEALGVVGASSPVVAGGLLVVPHSSGEVRVLRASDGKLLWAVNLSYSQAALPYALNDIDVPPLVKGNTLYLAHNAGTVFAIGLQTGQQVWKKEIPTVRAMWAAGNFLYVLTQDNRIMALEETSGRVKWLTALPNYDDEDRLEDKITMTGLILAGGSLFSVSSDGYLYALSPHSGKVRGKLSVDDDIFLPPIIVKRTLYLLSNEGRVSMLY